MIFYAEPVTDTKDEGVLRGIQRGIACDCWFTSTGTMLPRFIKVMDGQGQIYPLRVLSVIASEEKRFSGVETVEHICKVSLGEREEIVKLVFDKLGCRWKIVFL